MTLGKILEPWKMFYNDALFSVFSIGGGLITGFIINKASTPKKNLFSGNIAVCRFNKMASWKVPLEMLTEEMDQYLSSSDYKLQMPQKWSIMVFSA